MSHPTYCRRESCKTPGGARITKANVRRLGRGRIVNRKTGRSMKSKTTVKKKTELLVYLDQWKSLSVKKTLTGKDALEAVKRNGYALMYVKEQSAEVCLEAVKRNGDALMYVTEEVITEAEDK